MAAAAGGGPATVIAGSPIALRSRLFTPHDTDWRNTRRVCPPRPDRLLTAQPRDPSALRAPIGYLTIAADAAQASRSRMAQRASMVTLDGGRRRRRRRRCSTQLVYLPLLACSGTQQPEQ